MDIFYLSIKRLMSFSACLSVAQDKGHETVKKELQVCTPQPGGCAYNLDNVSSVFPVEHYIF